MACPGVAGLYGRANLEKAVAVERESKGVEVKGVTAEKECKGVEVGGVQLLQGKRVGSQEWRAIMAGQTWRKNGEMHQGRAGRKGEK